MVVKRHMFTAIIVFSSPRRARGRLPLSYLAYMSTQWPRSNLITVVDQRNGVGSAKPLYYRQDVKLDSNYRHTVSPCHWFVG